MFASVADSFWGEAEWASLMETDDVAEGPLGVPWQQPNDRRLVPDQQIYLFPTASGQLHSSQYLQRSTSDPGGAARDAAAQPEAVRRQRRPRKRLGSDALDEDDESYHGSSDSGWDSSDSEMRADVLKRRRVSGALRMGGSWGGGGGERDGGGGWPLRRGAGL